MADTLPDQDPRTSLQSRITARIRDLDAAINSAALSKQLVLDIPGAPGWLLFATVAALARVTGFEGIQFAILIDEFELLSEAQQRFVNTLIRDKPPRLGFVVGSRTNGVRTYQTATGEINRDGSEFATVDLDALHLAKPAAYKVFCASLIGRRLARAGCEVRLPKKPSVASLVEFFEEPDHGRLGAGEADFAGGSEGSRKSISALQARLHEHRPQSVSANDIADIVGALQVPESALLEKLGVYLFYRAWYGDRPLKSAATQIASDGAAFASGSKKRTAFSLAYGHFREDMLAQLRHEYRQRQRYSGAETLIELSAGLPRSLLVLMKHIYRWAVFNGERAFSRGVRISEETQRLGIREAAEWFLQDLPGVGEEGVAAREAVRRLGGFLRTLKIYRQA